MDWYLKVLRQYAIFSGRAQRKEYWMFFLINFLVIVALHFISTLFSKLMPLDILSALYSFGTIIPGVAVSTRRLHDTGRSAWWLLVALIPFFGAIALLYFMSQDGEEGSNEFGKNPKTSLISELETSTP